MNHIKQLCKYIFIVTVCVYIYSTAYISYASIGPTRQGTHDQSPTQIFESFSNTLKDKSNGVDSTFNDRIEKKTDFGDNKITNGVLSLKNAISPYIQWIMFGSLSGATILIIYNGFLLITSNGDDKAISNLKTNLKNIVIGVILITGFYVIIQIVLSLVIALSSAA